MTDLIAIAYPDTTTASAAMDEVHRLQSDLVIQADAVATIVCDKDGKYKTTTNHHSVGRGAMWGLFWGALFGILFFVPVLGIALGAGLGAVFGKIEKSGIDQDFINQVRGKLKPGTSALFSTTMKRRLSGTENRTHERTITPITLDKVGDVKSDQIAPVQGVVSEKASITATNPPDEVIGIRMHCNGRSIFLTNPNLYGGIKHNFNPFINTIVMTSTRKKLGAYDRHG